MYTVLVVLLYSSILLSLGISRLSLLPSVLYAGLPKRRQTPLDDIVLKRLLYSHWGSGEVEMPPLPEARATSVALLCPL
jgi:hypothetical protein